MTRRAWLVAVAILCLVAAMQVPGQEVKRVEAGGQTFSFTGAEQPFVVPAGVTRLQFDMYGAPGGFSVCSNAIPPICDNGYPDRVAGQLPVTPGQTLYIAVGGAGGTAGNGGTGTGGFNGGGNGVGAANNLAGGGGGASDIRTISRVNAGTTLNSRLVVAGGGGGVGGGQFPGSGGDAGTAGGTTIGGGGGGQPGTTNAGGAGGTTNFCGVCAGLAGSQGQGGAGGPPNLGGGGGGGGGGCYGGGGGGGGNNQEGGGGGGGSSCIFALNASIFNRQFQPASVALSWNAPPTITKSFGAASILVNGTTTMTFSVHSPASNISGLSQVAFTDTLPGGLVIANPNGFVGNCTAPTAVPGSSSVSWSTGNMVNGSTCNITLTVMGTTAGAKNNTTSNVTSVDTIGNTASASLTVTSPGVIQAPSILKAFGASSVALNGTTSLGFTIVNPNATTLTGIGFTDPLPAGLVVANPNFLTGNCGGGTFTAAPGSSSITLGGGTIAGNGNCVLNVTVQGTTAGLKTNLTGAVTSNEGGTGNQAPAQLAVAAGAVAPPTFSKSFTPGGIATVGVPFTLNFLIGNPNVSALTGIGFIDNLPPGLLVATPNGLTNNCGGTPSAVAGSSVVSLTNGTLAGGATCNLTVSVVASAAGLITNVTAAIVSNEGGGGVAAVNSVTVNPATVQPPTGQTPTTGTTPQVQATALPTTIPTVVVVVPPPIIPQVFQNPGAIGAIMTGPRNATPVPGAGAVRLPAVVLSAADPPVALRPPNTGDAGLRSQRAIGKAWRLLDAD